ncbi:ATP-binding protein [Paraneptunicella aestuarii]|uniref:AAA family ATPase n=1 Tax=Paraneptunicella aestuarii TaxID=2831148 RepID=UPI001E3B81BB|nr:AAA family ATPase [Paraneptunicella aestuarii]UAA40286.1 ATP-binding protein [Paraneptunicella aestuarii]
MSRDKITLKNIKAISELSVEFIYPESQIIVVTGKNGVGKTSIIKSFYLLTDPQIFSKSSGLDSIRDGSEILFEIEGFDQFSFSFDVRRGVLDSRDKLPGRNTMIAELPIPYGKRFEQFSLIASFDNEIRVGIATNQYESASDLIKFLSEIYSTEKFDELKAIKIGKNTFYFIPKEHDYYVREDHLSSGEFFLIQLYRLITSGAKLVLVDELDVALDAAAQVKLFTAIKPILERYETRLIVISHSLAFMSTVDDGCLYYLEDDGKKVTLERRSYGYVKSDLYGFIGKDRYIITEDEILEGFLKYLIGKHLQPFFEYEVIPVGGEPQVKAIAMKNDTHQIFGSSDKLIAVVDQDIYESINRDFKSVSKLYSSPVNDIELFIWQNKDRLLNDISQPSFTPARREKDTAKTYWRKVISSRQKTPNDLYSLVESEFKEKTECLVEALKRHLCLGS